MPDFNRVAGSEPIDEKTFINMLELSHNLIQDLVIDSGGYSYKLLSASQLVQDLEHFLQDFNNKKYEIIIKPISSQDVPAHKRKGINNLNNAVSALIHELSLLNDSGYIILYTDDHDINKPVIFRVLRKDVQLGRPFGDSDYISGLIKAIKVAKYHLMLNHGSSHEYICDALGLTYKDVEDITNILHKEIS